jgi:hypothetical protein
MIAAGAAPAAKPIVLGERLGYSVALGVGAITWANVKGVPQTCANRRKLQDRQVSARPIRRTIVFLPQTGDAGSESGHHLRPEPSRHRACSGTLPDLARGPTGANANRCLNSPSHRRQAMLRQSIHLSLLVLMGATLCLAVALLISP